VVVAADLAVAVAFLGVVGVVVVVAAAAEVHEEEEDSLEDSLEGAAGADSGEVVLAEEDEGFVDHIHEYIDFLSTPSSTKGEHIVMPQTEIRASAN